MAVTASDSPRAYLFDFDGTILDSFEDLERTTNEMLTSLSLPTLPVLEIRGMIGYGLEHLLRAALDAAGGAQVSTAHAVDVFKPLYANCGWRHTHLFEGMRALVASLASHRRALVSNKPVAACDSLIAHFELGGLFDLVAGGDTYPARKPDPMPILRTLEALSCPTQRAVMIGDDLPDVGAARAAGVWCVGVTWGRQTGDDLRAAGADVVVDSPAALADALRDWSATGGG